MTFTDIFKSSFLENFTAVSLPDMALTLFMAFILGAFIARVYRKTYQGVMYSAGFGITLMALTMISALVILAVTSNVVLSLGMVGALSIVRFRTAIKDPLDIAYLFWSIAAGIVLAAGLVPLAVLGSLFIGGILVLCTSKPSMIKPYIAVIVCDPSAEGSVAETLQEGTERLSLKSKSVRKDILELTYELRLKAQDTAFITALADTAGVESAVLVTYNGEYA
ncbi:MAG: DUF4956 domain-containing protein [Solobacterium sp.]|nr:DUF4956 domain-containing protein [Solobacterium sp.]